MPKVAEPPGPGDREELARQRFEHLRGLAKQAGGHHPDLLDAQTEYGKAIAERIRSTAHPDVVAKTEKMVASFPRRLSHTVVGSGEGGRQNAYMLSTLQFEEFGETGAWTGEPRPRGKDVAGQ